jgi:hypothetical protein
VKAFVIHMAEGGGTVGYLSRPNLRGVSVHYVIEYSGRIVQMVREDQASGSINPNDIRTSDGPTPYGATAAKAVMGAWWGNPNAAVITVEVEGFAAKGPNIDQRNALASLVADVRSRYPSMGLLGHRDFADYKACPGAFIPWPKLGGHGPASEVDTVAPIPAPADLHATCTLGVGDQLYDENFRPLAKVLKASTWPALFSTGTGYIGIAYGPSAGLERRLLFVKRLEVVITPIEPADPELVAKLAACEARARTAIIDLGGTP